MIVPARAQFELTDEQRADRRVGGRIRAARDRSARRAVGPRATSSRASSTRKLTDAGIMGMLVPEEYGGAGADYVSYALAIEELARVDAGTAVTRLGALDDLLGDPQARQRRAEGALAAAARKRRHDRGIRA